MQNKGQISFIEDESPQPADLDPFDPDPVEEDDLWFLPGPDHATLDDAHDLPLPQADRQPLVDVAAWAKAEATLARPLAELAQLSGMLRARLADGPEGWQHRLALQEAVDLSWLAGDRVPSERLALWQMLRLAGGAEDTQALARAGWAARRLRDGPRLQDDLATFLGRQAVGAEAALPDKLADWAEVMGQARTLHPITQAALGFHIWPVVGLSVGHDFGGAAPLALMEAAVVAARSSVAGNPVDITGRYFLPLALGGGGGLRWGGSAEDRLGRWIGGATHATRAALRTLDRLRDWDTRTQTLCSDLSGRTPAQLIALLRDWPIVSAPMAEKETGASRAAVQRNLNLLVKRGVAREVTGQERYRFWTTNMSV